jgi:poly-gamma-glutamate capsule biosynthesis protein CapA/YwtB (metallophosphatase superfamily)
MRIQVFRICGCVVFLTAAFLASRPAAQTITPYPSGPPFHDPPSDSFKFRDLKAELKNKMTGTYTVASIGDMFWRSPVVERMSPELRDILRNADTTFGNFEGGEGWQPRDTAKAFQSLGMDLIAPGEGVQAHELLAEFGIKMAGSGPNLTMARRPVFQELPQGRVALIAACPGTNLCGTPAADAAGATPARPGVNPLGVTVWNTVTAEQFNQLKAILDSVLARRHEADVVVPSDLPPPLPPGRLMLWGQRFMVAAKPGEIHYDLDPSDEQAQILAVRNAKEVADFVAFHMHVHHNRYSFQQYSHDNYPPDYLRPFLHKLIDNGLDMYFGSGNHSMQGIEIYKGRPIFYNQGNLGADLVRQPDSPPGPGDMTRTERQEQTMAYVQDEPTSVAYMARTSYKDGRLVEVRIYPVDVGIGKRAWSRQNIPETPSPELARSILERIQKYSEPFGTKISIENNIGIIRVPPEATVDVGGDLVIPGRQPRAR